MHVVGDGFAGFELAAEDVGAAGDDGEGVGGEGEGEGGEGDAGPGCVDGVGGLEDVFADGGCQGEGFHHICGVWWVSL